MESDRSSVKTCHRLLQNVLQDAFNVQTLLFTPPYGDFREIDKGMRAAVWTNYDIKDANHFFSDTPQEYRILIVKSNLGFYNILVTLTQKSPPEFISVGPFRDNELSANYFTQILKDAQITPAEIRRIRYMYERMPLAQVDAVVNVTKHILENFIPEFHDVVPEFLHFSEQKKAAVINNEVLDSYSIDYSETFKELLFQFLDHIKNGDNQHAKELLHRYLQETTLMTHKNMREYKMALQRIDDYCHLVLLQTSIHPLHILKQTESIKTRIEEATSLSRLEKIPNEICHKYCLLVKNYANSDCSKLTKDVITYIQLHLEEELSLNILAHFFKKNASVLSNTFSKDMGVNLTAYIHQTRIQAALKLFNTTDMSVSEVATAVGYQDFSYFSKIFSRYVGHSPRAYLTRNK